MLLAGPALPVSAQDPTGTITGTVTDPSGAVVAGVTVVVTNTDTGLKRVLVTNEAGAYSAPKLQIDTYTVEAELAGFKKYQHQSIKLGAGANIAIDVKLEVGQLTSLDLKFIDNLLISGRDSNTLVGLVPGAVKGNSTSAAFTASYNVNGVRDTSNNYTLDGTDYSDTWNSTADQMPPPDSLREFTVQSNYSAEFGHGGGAGVIAVTKSGTNDFHGTVCDYFQSENLNANTFQRNSQGLPKGELKRHLLGYTVGGPVYLPKIYNGRNRSFFFFSYQALKVPATAYTVGHGGLTQAELNGDFSNSAIIPKVSSAAANAPNSPFAGKAGQTVTNLAPYLSQHAVMLVQIL